MVAGLRLPPGFKLTSVLPKSFLLSFASPVSSPSPARLAKNIGWIEGVRGVAAIIVVLCHICSTLDIELLRPQNEPYVAPRVWQWPFVRIIFAGKASVAVFFVVTGFVNALRPLQLSYGGQTETAILGLSRSAAKRFGQLMVPATVATVINWVLCELGAFELNRRGESDWIAAGSPIHSATLFQAIKYLPENLIGTWTRETNYLDSFQWCLSLLLKASMTIYLTLLATLRLRPKVRMCILIGLVFYSFFRRDVIIGTNSYGGMLLAELSVRQGTDAASVPSIRRRLLAGVLITIGLYLASYPDVLPELTPWCTMLKDTAEYLAPKGIDISRVWVSLGAILSLFGVFLSPFAQRLLSHPFLVKGGQLSLAIYLVHHAIMRTFFTWLLYRVFSSEPRDAAGNLLHKQIPLPTKPYKFIAGGLTMVVIVCTAQVWHNYVQPWCVRRCEAIEAFIFGDSERSSGFAADLPLGTWPEQSTLEKQSFEDKSIHLV